VLPIICRKLKINMEPLYVIDIKSCLVLGAGGLERVKCPFKVKCINAVGVLKIDEVSEVVSVRSSALKNKIIFEVDNAFYYHSNFVIEL
jgi:hypothetical protein